MYAYDAANVIVAASLDPLNGNQDVTREIRAGIVETVQAGDLAGASGRVAFDEFGDTRSSVLTLYRVSEGAWKPTLTKAVP